MATTEIRNKYHVAINTVGYMLRGAPNKPAYTRSVVPSQVNRLAISDLAYSDFAGTGLFYLAQTDWSAGIKTESVWRDDAKFYYSTNIDAYSKQGAIQADLDLVLENTFTEDLYCGITATVSGNQDSFVGTYKASDNHVKIYRLQSPWTDIAGTTFSTNQSVVSCLIGHKNKLYAGTAGGGNTVVESYNGTTWTDHTAAIDTAMGWGVSILAGRSSCELGGVLYIAVDNYLNNASGIVSTADNGTTWVKEVSLGNSSPIVSMCGFLGKLYYLVYYSYTLELRCFDPATHTDISVNIFKNASANNAGMSNRYLEVMGGKLIITIPYLSIYEFDGTDLNRIFLRDDTKVAIGTEAYPSLIYGGMKRGERMYWNNLVYDGENFYNYKKVLGDSTSNLIFPIFTGITDNFYYQETLNSKKLYKDTSTYKPTLASNFLIFNEMSPIVSIDKLLYSVTAIFEKMVSGDQIKIEYSINNRATWVTVGILSLASEGSTNVKREFVIPNSVLFNKIWWKVSMANSGGASSPVLLDLIMAYRPMPSYKNQWQMRLNMSDGIKLLNRQNDSREGHDMHSQLWNEKLLKRQVKFQDVDYIECTVKTAMTKTQTSAKVTAIKKLPIQGRLRAVSGSVAEEMYYTSAKNNIIMGITRGVRGTTARDYPSGQVLDNGYNVYVSDITSTMNFTDEEKTESIAQVLLIEA